MKRLLLWINSILWLGIPLAASALEPIGNPLNNNAPEMLGGGPELFVRFILLLVTFLGVFCLAAVLYGGGLWLTSAGNSEKVDKGKSILIWAGIGIAVVAGAYAILKYIIEAFDAGGAAFQ